MSFGKRWSQADLDRLTAKDKPKEDKRTVRGAQPQEVNGIKFASKLELYFYNLLSAVNIKFNFQHELVAQEAFNYRGKVIRPIKIILDFYIAKNDCGSEEIMIDTKGFATPANKLKWKLAKSNLAKQGKEPEIHFPRTKEECDALVNQLLKLKSNVDKNII